MNLNWIRLTTIGGNQAPTITSDGGGATATINAAENQTAVTDVDATDDTDSEGSGLSYSISGGVDASLFSIDPSTGVLSFISAPDYENPTDSGVDNVYDVQVTVTDSGGLTDVQDIAVTVTDVVENTAPTITSTPVTSAIEGALYSYDVEASDPNAGDTLTFSLDTAPGGMSIDPVSGLIQWTPTNAQLGDNAVTVRVSDGSLFDTQSFTITVVATNQAPTITSTPLTSAIQGELYSYDVEASDPSPGDTLIYSLFLAPSGMSIDPASGLIQWTPDGGQIGDNSITVQVRDNASLMDSQSFTVTITDVPD
jgi:hypothetical protein